MSGGTKAAARERAISGPMWEPGERVLRLLLETSAEPVMRERAYLIAAGLFYGPDHPNAVADFLAAVETPDQPHDAGDVLTADDLAASRFFASYEDFDHVDPAPDQPEGERP